MPYQIQPTLLVKMKEELRLIVQKKAEKMLNCSRLERPRAVSELNVCYSKEVSRLSTCKKFKETKLLRRVRLQNGGNIHTGITFRKRQLSLKNGPKRRLFLISSSPGLLEICEVSMAIQTISSSLSAF